MLQQGVGRHVPRLAELRVGHLDAHDLLPRPPPTMARLRRLTIDEACLLPRVFRPTGTIANLVYCPCVRDDMRFAPTINAHFQRDALRTLLRACPALEALASTI